jgi:hypothetical protein
MSLAVWHLDCAINLNPTFVEALNLRAKITGKELTDVDNSAIRRFVRDQIMAETRTPATGPSPEPSAPPSGVTARIDTTKPSVSRGPTTRKDQSASIGGE